MLLLVVHADISVSFSLKGFKGSPAVLRGDERPYARFGSAISSVGDLNKDSYNGKYKTSL